MSNEESLAYEGYAANDMELFTRLVARAIARFSGDVHELEAAIGVLYVGHLFGYKFIRLAHSKRTIRKYEAILGVEFKHLLDDLGPAFYRSAGLAFVSEQSNFWKCVSGEVKVPDRCLILTHQEVAMSVLDPDSSRH